MKNLGILFCLFISRFAYSQDLPVQSEYHLNKSLINPAIIGSEECTWIKGTDRHQWLGMEGAPQIQTISYETSISKKKVVRETDRRNHGLGAFLYRDKNGAYQNLGGQVSYAYHFYLNKPHEIKLGLGLSFQLLQSSLNESNFRGDQNAPSDPIISGGSTSVITFNSGAGAFLYNQKFYAGISAANLLPIYKPMNGSISRNYFIITGYLTGNNRDRIRWYPSMVIKFTEDLRKQIDLNTKILFGNDWWAGLSYRHNLDAMPGIPLSIIPMIGMNKGNFGFGYALNLTPGSIQRYNYGTHEFTITYHFCGNDGYRCPVYR